MNAKKFKKTATFTLVMLVSLLLSLPAFSASRIKDIADFEGVRDNQLVGYGMVVGLNGTGDNIKSINFAKESLVSLLDSVGINSRDGQLKSKNIAAVMVTANLPAFARQGSRIDVMVSALGDAQKPAGRHADCHTAGRRQRRSICRGAGAGCRRRRFGPRRNSFGYQRGSDFRTHCQRRDY